MLATPQPIKGPKATERELRPVILKQFTRTKPTPTKPTLTKPALTMSTLVLRILNLKDGAILIITRTRIRSSGIWSNI